MKHTKLPWTAFDCATHWEVYGIGEKHNPMVVPLNIGLTAKRTMTTKANAEFIVKACNTHYDLLEALDLITGGLMNDSPKNPEKQRKALLKIAQQAIAKTERKQSIERR